MKTFYDNSNRRWCIALNLGTVKRVMDAIGVNLLNPSYDSGDGRALSVRLLMDDYFFGSIVAEIIRPQCFANKVDENELFDLFDAETLLAAQTAFNEEYRDFFERRGNTANMKILTASEAAKEQANKRVIDDLENALNGSTSSELPVAQDLTTSANSVLES